MLISSLAPLVLFILPGLLWAARMPFTYRLISDVSNEHLETDVISACNKMVEDAVNFDDPEGEMAIERKRAFLVFIHFLRSPVRKYRKPGAKGPVVIAASFDYFATLNYPICTEALELSVDILTAEEAVYAAEKMPDFFFTASPAVLSAIPDWSAFTHKKIEKSFKYGVKTLLEIRSAVVTLPIESVAALMASYHYNFTPTAQKHLQLRTEELALLAWTDIRLLYQYFLNYFSRDEFKGIQGYMSELQKSTKSSAKSSKKVSKKNDEQSAFGDVIDVAPVRRFKHRLADKEEEYIMLAFSYAVNADIILEHLFAAIHLKWNEFEASRKAFFGSYEKYLDNREHREQFEALWNNIVVEEILKIIVRDLKRIVEERKKLLEDFALDADVKLLLSVPLSWTRREELRLASKKSDEVWTPSNAQSANDLICWLWNHVMADYKKRSEFPFQNKSTMEIFKAFVGFINKHNLTRFGGGINSSFFFEVLFSENPEFDADKEVYVSTMLNLSAPYFASFGGLGNYVSEEAFNETSLRGLRSNAENFLKFYREMKVNDGYIEDGIYAKLTNLKRMFETKIQFMVTPRQLAHLLEVSKSDSPEAKEENAFLTIFEMFPELLGYDKLRFLIFRGWLTEKMIQNLPAPLILKLKDLISLDDLNLLTRGLVAVPFDKVGSFLRGVNYRLRNADSFLQAVNSDFITTAAMIDEESIKLIQLMTPNIVELSVRTDRILYQLPEIVDRIYAAKRNIEIVHRAVLHWLVMFEVNFMKFALNSGAKDATENALITVLGIEKDVRSRFLALFDSLEIGNETSTVLRSFLELRTLSPSRAVWLEMNSKNPKFAALIGNDGCLGTIGNKHLFKTIENVFNRPEDESMCLELLTAAHLLFFDSPEQGQLPTATFNRFFSKANEMDQCFVDLVNDMIKHNQILLDREFVYENPVIREREMMAAEDIEAKKRRIREKLAAAQKKL